MFCCILKQVANLYRLKDLLEKCYTMTCANFMNMCQDKAFLQLRYGEIQSLVMRSDLVADSETCIFKAIIRWIESDK